MYLLFPVHSKTELSESVEVPFLRIDQNDNGDVKLNDHFNYDQH